MVGGGCVRVYVLYVPNLQHWFMYVPLCVMGLSHRIFYVVISSV